ncbi:MAG: methyltransferase domain-containing protein [Roseococcus sp.]
MILCNICGGDAFKPGPNNRMAPENIAPVCVGCGSFERHRAVRQVFDQVRPRNFGELDALQFGRDRGIAGGWFKSFKRAGDDKKDLKIVRLSLDRIALPDAAMDVVVCNFVLETLPDYRAALREIGRVISDHGFGFIAVQSPNLRKVTQELSSAEPGQGDRRRTFGQDIEPELGALLPDLHVIRVVGVDPVTHVEAWGYFIAMDDDFAGFLFERGLRAKFVNVRKVMA